MAFPPLRRGSILCGTRFTKSAQEPECGHENALLSGRTIYVIGPLQLGKEMSVRNERRKEEVMNTYEIFDWKAH